MKYSLNHFLYLLIVFSLTSCEKEDPIESKPLPDSRYPSSYEYLSPTSWDERNDAFQKIKMHNDLKLDSYGFVWGDIECDENDLDNLDSFLPKLDSLLEYYHEFMGIDNFNQIDLKNDLEVITYGQVGTYEPSIDEFEIYKEKYSYMNLGLSQEVPKVNFSIIYITVHFKENKIRIDGNWFPNIYIPADEIYSKKEAVSIASEHHKKKSGNLFNDAEDNISIKKEFVIKWGLNGLCQLFECWHLIVKEEALSFYVDTQTGELMSLYQYDSDL